MTENKHQSKAQPTNPAHAGLNDKSKRDTLKKITATAGVVAASAMAAPAVADHIAPTKATPAAAKQTTLDSPQQLTINIQMNREELDDWVLIENTTEQPLIVKSFQPRFIQYRNQVLDLNALLSRQQRGKNQLEIWPNQAWTHSVRNATRAAHPLRPAAAPLHVASMDTDVRSLQIGVQVAQDGKASLLQS